MQYTVASPDFVCLMDGGSSVYCGQSYRRLIALWGPAVQYTVASLTSFALWTVAVQYTVASLTSFALWTVAVQYTVASLIV